jgi:hypothetical protein
MGEGEERWRRRFRGVTTRATMGADCMMWPARDWAEGATVMLTRRRDCRDVGGEGHDYDNCGTPSNDASTRKQEATFMAVVVRVVRRRCCRRGEEATIMTTFNNDYNNDRVECRHMEEMVAMKYQQERRTARPQGQQQGRGGLHCL